MSELQKYVIDYIDTYIKEHYRMPQEISVQNYCYRENLRNILKTGEYLFEEEFHKYRVINGEFHGYPFCDKIHEIYAQCRVMDNGKPLFSNQEDRSRYDTDEVFRNHVDYIYNGKY